MIPYRISFSGIRDYKPRTISLMGKRDHILISGANGAGKSTLTFCWGAVMASTKVNVEGLRSKNLSDNRVWRAKIELIYENDGFVDAARFVRFTLDLEQEPGHPLKKEYYIAEGDRVDEWEQETRFSSSDKHFNFREYKRMLLQKYKIDPDAFYLIWYQQDVNQFAVMKPEERFRIFSEMTGIESIQKSWESFKEQERDKEAILQTARNNQIQYKFELERWEKEKNRYEDQQSRIKRGILQYKTALCTLEDHYYTERMKYKDELEDVKENLDEKYEEAQQGEKQFAQLEAELLAKQAEFQSAEKEREIAEERQLQCKKESKDKEREWNAMKEEIKDVTDRVKNIGISEDVVRAEKSSKEQQLQEAEKEKVYTEQLISETSYNLNELRSEVAKLEVQVDNDEAAVVSAKNYIEQYKSSFYMEEKHTKVESMMRQTKDLVETVKKDLQQKYEEKKQLELNRYVSPRQEEGLRYFRREGLQAYPLRDLIELEGDAEFRHEDILNTIKYAIFVESKEFRPPNDLYYVPLPLIVPTESVISLPQYKLRIKEGDNEKLVSVAMKALWWVKQFFTGEQPCIQKNSLIDIRGFRGEQEKTEYILSEKAIMQRLEETGKWIEEHEKQLIQYERDIQTLEEKERKLHDIVYKLRDAEAVLQKAAERTFRIEQLGRKTEEKQRLEQEIQRLYAINQELHTRISRLRERLETLEQYEMIYEELHKEKEKIAHMQKLEQIHRELLDELKRVVEQRDILDETCNRLEIECNKASQKTKQQKQEVEELCAYIQRLEKKKKDVQEHFITTEEKLISIQRENQDANDTYGKLLEQLGWEKQIEEWSEAKALSQKQSAEITLEGALGETVDPLAPENYAKMKEENEKSNAELHNAEQILNELRENIALMRERLETTIQMNAHKIHKKFEQYMEQFHFEGKVEWNMDTNKHGDMRYYLYIKARKKGHRGKMEDISAKGRGGKVGSGVSGGEESLSSLLFALALLQTIEASPGYIILDEYDSALDDSRKEKVFTLFEQELNRKMIIVSPKSHDPNYLQHFSQALTVMHDASVPVSRILQVKRAIEETETVSKDN
ncbi:hypothetical protein [Bacillus cereus]|uniref:hypothetical protein n=1 Tax=Bacillus cereus TaxID=1396 RepID=UPI002B2499C0|nr:hypothetical protein [Bacillus cereus]MEB2588729.1 hypothetical protein [Bacillus cereus]MEB2615415.1 hypothetical protein [Bacillus cereus]